MSDDVAIGVKQGDPLPESNWLWRRVFVFALCTAILLSDWAIIQAMINLSSDHSDLTIKALRDIVMWQMVLAWFAMTYYIVGTNAEAVVKIVQTASMFKSGIVSTVTQAVDGNKATTTTATGPVVVPPTAPAAPSVPPILNKLRDIAPAVGELAEKDKLP